MEHFQTGWVSIVFTREFEVDGLGDWLERVIVARGSLRIVMVEFIVVLVLNVVVRHVVWAACSASEQ